MRLGAAFLAMIALVATVACSEQTERQWMKLDKTYTTADFRRDYAECSKKGDLDDECMKARGWIPMTPPATKKQVEEPYRPGQYKNRI